MTIRPISVLGPARTIGRRAAEARLAAAAEVSLLALAILALGVLLIPSHWTSIWNDREFSGWVAPISNRLAHGTVLYRDGAHVPMPPLPFVLIEVVARGHATWLTESRLNFLFQALMIATLYLWLGRHLRRPWAFLATFAAIPVYFSLPKTVAYDAMAQCFTAWTAILVSVHLCARRAGWGTLVATAGAASLTLVCKQSTGAGVLLGSTLAILLYDRAPLRRRLVRSAGLIGLALVLLAVAVLLMRRWVDPAGFVRDVLWTSSEAKGGVRMLARSSLGYDIEIATCGAVFLIAGLAFIGAFGRTDRRSVDPSGNQEFALDSSPVVLAAALAAVAGIAAAAVLARPVLPYLVPEAQVGVVAVLWAGLFLLGVLAWRERTADSPGPRMPRELVVAAPVLLCAAWFHSFSVLHFRWTYDNNPLISLALAALVFLMARGSVGRPDSSPRLASMSLGIATMALSFLTWASFVPQLAASRQCTDSWPEIAYLQGARLTRAAAGMRQLVATVRRLAPDARADEVLLLPEDPNVEAWLDRPRPALAGAIVFTDQYLDRYVEGDLARLERRPPRVIVIGPRDSWREFSRIWNPGRGCERLIDLVRARLLPGRYRWVEAQPIQYGSRPDFMDVFVRPQTASAAGPR